jgi:hypothetical protein
MRSVWCLSHFNPWKFEFGTKWIRDLMGQELFWALWRRGISLISAGNRTLIPMFSPLSISTELFRQYYVVNHLWNRLSFTAKMWSFLTEQNKHLSISLECTYDGVAQNQLLDPICYVNCRSTRAPGLHSLAHDPVPCRARPMSTPPVSPVTFLRTVIPASDIRISSQVSFDTLEACSIWLLSHSQNVLAPCNSKYALQLIRAVKKPTFHSLNVTTRQGRQ